MGAEILVPTGTFYFLFLCLYFIRTCCFVSINLHFSFCLYCTTYTTQTSMFPAGFEPTIPTGDRPQTVALDRSATGIGGIRSPDRPDRSKSLYRLSYPGPPLFCNA